MSLVMLNGVLLPVEQASIPVTDRGLTHGLGLYETLKLLDGVPVFFDEHVARLDLGMQELGLEPPCPRSELATQIWRLACESDVLNGACRLLVTAGSPGGDPTLLIQTDRRTFPPHPLRVVSYLGVRVGAQLKAITVMQSFLAQRAAAAAGVDDAILVDDEGRIFEGATSNMFLARGGGLVTPPAEGAILPGVLRAKIDELATADGIPVIEAYVRIPDLRPDDGMLLTSSVRGIVAVKSVDNYALQVDEELLMRLRSLVAAAEAASATDFRTTYC